MLQSELVEKLSQEIINQLSLNEYDTYVKLRIAISGWLIDNDVRFWEIDVSTDGIQHCVSNRGD